MIGRIRDLLITCLVVTLVVMSFQAIGESLSPQMTKEKMEAYNADRIRHMHNPHWKMTGKPSIIVPPYDYEEQ